MANRPWVRRLLQASAVGLMILLLTGCPLAGLLRMGALRGASSGVVGVGRVVAIRSALGHAAARAGISMTESLAIRGAAAGAARSGPLALANAEIVDVFMLDANGTLIMRGTLARAGNSVTLVDAQSGSIRGLVHQGQVAFSRADGTPVGRATYDVSGVKYHAGAQEFLGRDRFLANGQIQHLDPKGVVIGTTDIRVLDGMKRRIIFRIGREFAEDVMSDLNAESSQWPAGETERTNWVKASLENSNADWVTDSRSARRWLNGPFNEMIDAYRTRDGSFGTEATSWSAAETEYVLAGFRSLRARVELLGRIYLRGGKYPVELGMVNDVIEDLESRLSVLKKREQMLVAAIESGDECHLSAITAGRDLEAYYGTCSRLGRRWGLVRDHRGEDVCACQPVSK